MMAWLLVAVIIACTVASDLLQSREMRDEGRVDALRVAGLRRLLGAVARRRNLLLAIGCHAVSFFSFLALLRVADLSFAVPATAGSIVVETVLARVVLRERVDQRRWAGALLVAGGVALLAV